MWVQLLELNENGEYIPVEVTAAPDVHTGGIFQLKQVGGGSACLPREGSLWDSRSVTPCSSPTGPVPAHPGGDRFRAGFGHHAPGCGDDPSRVCGLCGDSPGSHLQGQ